MSDDVYLFSKVCTLENQDRLILATFAASKLYHGLTTAVSSDLVFYDVIIIDLDEPKLNSLTEGFMP